MTAYLSPHEAFTAILRGAVSYVPSISWGATASPWYREVPEPPPPFPYVVYSSGSSIIEDQSFPEASTSGYIEKFTYEVSVVATEDLIHSLSSPWADRSVMRYLDTISKSPGILTGKNFTCEGFVRTNYELMKEENRGPVLARRVWIGRSLYEMVIVADYPNTLKPL